jgi:hypothetical protein
MIHLYRIELDKSSSTCVTCLIWDKPIIKNGIVRGGLRHITHLVHRIYTAASVAESNTTGAVSEFRKSTLLRRHTRDLQIRRAAEMGEMSWVGKKIHLYNVTMGLYMLDWWERCLFSILPSALDLIPLPLQFVKKICWMARRSSLCAVHHHLIFFRFALRFGLGSGPIRSWGK